MLSHFQPSALQSCFMPPSVCACTPAHLYLLLGRAAVWQGDAFVDEGLVGVFVLVEDLLDGQAAFEHLHLFLLLERHLQPLLGSQDLLLQGGLQFLKARHE